MTQVVNFEEIHFCKVIQTGIDSLFEAHVYVTSRTPMCTIYCGIVVCSDRICGARVWMMAICTVHVLVTSSVKCMLSVQTGPVALVCGLPIIDGRATEPGSLQQHSTGCQAAAPAANYRSTGATLTLVTSIDPYMLFYIMLLFFFLYF